MFSFIFLSIFTTLLLATDTAINDTQDRSNPRAFEIFLTDIRAQARKQGISTATLDAAFNGLTPNPKVLEYDRNQAEFTLNFWHYLNSRVSNKRLQKGKISLKKNQDLLMRVYQKYGVRPEILVSIWGLETNYGEQVGKMNLVRSLATLGFDLRRRDFFSRELLALLKLIDEGKLPLNAKGSWAGAMGNTQFMPSNVAAYGIDADADGNIDLWNSLEDIMSSSANFLNAIGWHRGEKWGHEVKITADFDFSLANINLKKSLNEWHTLGVRLTNNADLPNSNKQAALILPMGFKGPAFLVYHNFYAILRWNNSILYALSVGHLADKIINNQTLSSKPIAQPSLSRDDILSIQTKLIELGFNAGKPDGIAGPKTRSATRAYQKHNALPADGYVGYQLLQQLQP